MEASRRLVDRAAMEERGKAATVEASRRLVDRLAGASASGPAVGLAQRPFAGI